VAYSYQSYNGNGSTVLFAVPFPYLVRSHVKVYIGFNILTGSYTSELSEGVGFTWVGGTQIQCSTPPGSGQVLTVVRQTPTSTRLVDWSDGAQLTAADLDTADLQGLYALQEQQDRNDASVAQSASALSTANSAAATAAAANAAAAAVTQTANTALTNSTNAVSTANTAAAAASSASSTATSAASTANTASATAGSALTTANAATSSAASAVGVANTASAKADQALAAVSSAVAYQLKANISAIPASPADNTYIEVQDSTGIETFSPLAGRPASFVGDPGLTVRLRYTTAGATWNWLNYFATNPETRYLRLAGGAISGSLGVNTSTPSAPLHVAGIARIGANSTADAELQIGVGATGNRNAYIDLVGDATYTDYGLRLWRGDTGPNTNSHLLHRGTGTLYFGVEDAGNIVLGTSSIPRLVVGSTGSVGINTLSPQATLDVFGQIVGASTAYALRASNGGGSSQTSIGLHRLGAPVDQKFWEIIQGGGGDLQFRTINDNYTAAQPGLAFFRGSSINIDTIVAYTNGIERLRIDSSGRIGLGTDPQTATTLWVSRGPSGSPNQYGVYNNGIIQNDVTNHNSYYTTVANTQAASFNLGQIIHFWSTQGTFGAGSVVANQYGFFADPSLVGATNNYGFYSGIPAGANRWNFFAGGTANNYFAGNVGIGGAPATKLLVYQPSGIVTSRTQSGATGFLDIAHDGTNAYILTSGGPLTFYQGATETARFDANSRFLLGTGVARTNFFNSSYGPSIQLENADPAFSVVRNDNSVFAPLHIFAKTRGAGSVIVQNNDTLGQISFQGSDGSEFVEAAAITASVDNTPGANDMPGRLSFWTAPDGGAAPVERVRVDSTGLASFYAGVSGAVVIHTSYDAGTRQQMEWTNIPSWVRRFSLTFNDLALNSTEHILIQLGNVNWQTNIEGYITTGYLSRSSYTTVGGATGGTSRTDGAVLFAGSSANRLSGRYTFETAGPNEWVGTGLHMYDNDAQFVGTNVARRSLESFSFAVITRIRMLPTGTPSASNRFNSGSVRLTYEG
jgi:hypothetical protein